MKVASIEVFVLNCPVKAVFVLAGGVAATLGMPSPRVLVKVTADDGASGWGEATPTPRWTYETTAPRSSSTDPSSSRRPSCASGCGTVGDG